MAFHIEASETKPLTPEVVSWFSGVTPSVVEREFDEKRVILLDQKAEEGLLTSFRWDVVKYNGDLIRVNGQHSSEMLRRRIAQNRFPGNHLFLHLDTYTAETENDLVMLFRQFDPKISTRTSKDIAGAYMNLYSDLRDAADLIKAKLIIEGIHWYLVHTVGTAKTIKGDDRYDLFNDKEIHPFILWLAEKPQQGVPGSGGLFTDKNKELHKHPVIGAIYATWKANQEEAPKFWTEVARGGSTDEPAYVLDAWLTELYTRNGNKKQKILPADVYAACVNAWNSYREGKQIRKVLIDTKKVWPTIANA